MAIPTSLQKTPRTAKDVAVRTKPYFETVAPGVALGYRRNRRGGNWVVRATDGRGKHWTNTFAIADDVEVANGETVMSYSQALKRAPIIVRGSSSDSSGSKQPITVERAIDAYETDLIARNQSPRSKYNASMIRLHVKDTPIYQTSVALLKQQAVADIRNGLVASGLEPSSADRIGKCLKAALNLAASHDARITNAKAWSDGWSMLPNSSVARNIILADAIVVAIVRAAYQADHKLGVYFDVLAETGTRESQMLRLRVRDLQDNRPDPRLMMPKDRKGKNPKPGFTPVPISARLAATLRLAVAGRGLNAAILDKIDHPEEGFRDIAKVVGGVDPEATPYSFRHSSIVRMLIRNIPIRVVASLHNTSVVQIEKHYSAFITNVSDEMTRATLPDFGTPAAA